MYFCAAGTHVHVDEYHCLSIYGSCVQLLPQVLRPRGGRRGPGLQMSRHVLGRYLVMYGYCIYTMCWLVMFAMHLSLN